MDGIFVVGNHKSIASASGFKEVKNYRYWNQEERNLDFKGMIEDLTVVFFDNFLTVTLNC